MREMRWEKFARENNSRGEIADALNGLSENPATRRAAMLLALWIGEAELERRRLARRRWVFRRA